MEVFVNASGHRSESKIPSTPLQPKSKHEFINRMKEGSEFIHISCHGDHKRLYLRNKQKFDYDEFGSVEFRKETRLLFINACEAANGPTQLSALVALCDGKLANKFVIAPSNKVSFETALTFSIIFYDLLLARNMGIPKAFELATTLKGYDDLDYYLLNGNNMKTCYRGPHGMLAKE
ncbi:MAG: hypothetical protein ACYCPW_12900 [Nitrososphaerales archaeon]